LHTSLLLGRISQKKVWGPGQCIDARKVMGRGSEGKGREGKGRERKIRRRKVDSRIELWR